MAAAPPEVGFEQRIGPASSGWMPFIGGDGVEQASSAPYFGGKTGGAHLRLLADALNCARSSPAVPPTRLRQLEATAERDYSVISVSVDPTDTSQMADSRQREDVLKYGRAGAFLRDGTFW